MKCVALVSGGIDSPVAAYLAMRCNFRVTPLVMDNGSFSQESVRKAGEIMGALKKNRKGEFHYVIAPHYKSMQEFVSECPRKLTCILCKRMMLRVACRLAEKEGGKAVVTGETLGSKASQTLKNLGVVSQASNLPVVRPLLALNKEEIEKIAREIGTFNISSRGGEHCKAVPEGPSTKADLEDVFEAERNIDVDALADWAVENSRKVNL
ncbi:MAG: 7-cyano-7-deazaguanine synthase [Candidatus Micrarchaeota archaeon]|nr:7-cyano-7-deazaguanine synthase [Candidatus Micrarchaeota archaeon]